MRRCIIPRRTANRWSRDWKTAPHRLNLIEPIDVRRRISDANAHRILPQTAVTLNANVQTIQTKPPQQANDNISLIKRGMAFPTSKMFSLCSMFPVRSRQAQR
ncbi:MULTISPECIES: hypothetical protein [unclassified Brevundimonas]|uniref:hypothetical protein n=1 Tax=unclassified Brevundimonas TaxID=2622653 RepID=UPI002005B99A|nr:MULTISPECIES: hypothetical protein [unclassified Brevundimonas]MCK6103010.1 hypothetical protein [Brevundimonas sp. EYE_349]